MKTKCWTVRVADAAEELLRTTGSCDWKTLANTFYKRTPSKSEIQGIVKRRRFILKELVKRGLPCHSVSEYYFNNIKIKDWAPVCEEEAKQCLPGNKRAFGLRLSEEYDLIWTAFMNLEDAKFVGRAVIHKDRILESISNNRLTMLEKFKINKVEHTTLFLTE